jgi:hypothetical protein
LYFTFGTAVLVVAGAVAAINGNFYSAAVSSLHPRPYFFWTSGTMIVAYFITGVALVLFVAGACGLPFPPWAKARFPDLEIEVTSMKSRGYPPGPNPDLWMSFSLRLTNREVDQNASITVRYRPKLDPTQERGRQFGELIFFGDRSDPPSGVPTDWLAQPLNLLPQHSAGGYLVWRIEKGWADTLANPSEACFLVEDHATNRAVVIPAWIGNYTNANWRVPGKDAKGSWYVYPATESPASNADGESPPS